MSLVGNLAVDLAPRVRVNAVLPATVGTRVWDGQPGGADRCARSTRSTGSAAPRTSRPRWRSSPATTRPGITGHALPVDGGLLTGGTLRRLVT